jgi:hypothetical protein
MPLRLDLVDQAERQNERDAEQGRGWRKKSKPEHLSHAC